ncbi:MAG: hypothetical protein M1840_000420 [Geoglossum simile]|nr:MAG: hypothetical protein M1840_000420 [Geoglossum simile]
MSSRSSSDHIDTRSSNDPALATFLHDRTSTDYSPLRDRYDDYDFRSDSNNGEDDDCADQAGDGRRSPKLGLAISGVHGHPPAQHHRRTSSGISLPRKPVESQSSPGSPWTPNANTTSEPLLPSTSPPPPPVAVPRGLRIGPRQRPPWPPDKGGSQKPPLGRGGGGGAPFPSSRGQSPDDSLMRKKLLGDLPCKSRQNIEKPRLNWITITITILAVYSTIFSGIFLVIAVTRPRYGRKIQTRGGGMSPSTATLLSAFFAKTIELSFITVFVAFLGQVLSRSAFYKGSKGITIAEMSMRSLLTKGLGQILQPGSMLVNWESVKYAALTFLGIISLTAALIATLYTTASEVLVAPKLRLGPTEQRLLHARVSTKYAYTYYAANHCQTPIKTDPDISGRTCLQIDYAGQSFHNYAQYLAAWSNNTNTGTNPGSDPRTRPNAVGTLYSNTTVHGSWVEIKNTTEVSEKFKRTINNITMAMPHAGVFAAAREPTNNILQPEDLGGLGEYIISASVPSPSVNVLCASMNESELYPFIQENWPKNTTDNSSMIPHYPSSLNKTVVDDVFGFGKPYGSMNVTRPPPIFPKLPIDFNTVLNATGWFADSIYLLGKSNNANPPYVMCSLRSALYPKCSTRYNASSSGGMLISHCDDDKDPLQYAKHHPEAPIGWVEPDWANIASEWARSLSLNSGVSDGNSSNARLLTQFILGADPVSPKPVYPANQLQQSLPSIAEALAVLAGYPLLLSTRDSPLIHFWQYVPTTAELTEPQYEAFNASIRVQQYASGSTQPWQNIFHVVLVLVFGTNLLCLVFLLTWPGQVTDYTEPQNLFALAMNSPPSRKLEGSCGGGPEHRQLTVGWRIMLHNEHEHVYLMDEEGATEEDQKEHIEMEAFEGGTETQKSEGSNSPIVARYMDLSSKRSSGTGFLGARIF